MELKLQKMIDDLIGVADTRNLSPTNPIQFTLQNPNSGDDVIIMVAYREPWEAPQLPVNVVWINYDPEDVYFKRALKRVDKTDPGAGSTYNHTWEVLETYNSVFEPAQYYDGGFSDIHGRFDDHIDYLTNPNPHNTTAESINAVSLDGGTLLGPLIARSLGVGDQYASGELIPKDYVDTLVDGLNTEITQLQDQLNSTQVVTYKHDQGAISSTWNVTHNLGSEDLIVQVYDSSGFMMLPNSVRSTGLNTLVIAFEEQLNGTAVMVPVGAMAAP